MSNAISWLPGRRSRQLLPLLLATLAGCATPPGPPPGTGSPWECVPVDPAWTTLPTNPCFRATVSAGNKIALQWRVADSNARIYIYDDFGRDFTDIGFQPANCPSDPEQTCSTTLPISQGGFYRWLLRAEDAGGNRVHVPTEIQVPARPSSISLDGGGFVDVLSPRGRHIYWSRTDQAPPAGVAIESTWIEMKAPRLFRWYKLEGSAAPGTSGAIYISAEELREPGSVTYYFRECFQPGEDSPSFCNLPNSVNFQVGPDRFLNQGPVYTPHGSPLELSFTAKSGDERRISSDTLLPPGREYEVVTGDSYTVDASLVTSGHHEIELASCLHESALCGATDTLHILVDAPVNWQLGRSYRKDFHAGTAHPVLGPGFPLGITFDDAGGIWLINEFSTSIEHLSQSGEVTSFTIPLGRYAGVDPSSLAVTRPFSASLVKNRAAAASFSSMGERATRVGSTLWFTQGGSAAPSDIANHSRMISFDPSLSNSPTTPFDDRICVYNVPSADPNQCGNSAVIGLTGAAGRIWIGESRGLWGREPSAISSFIPKRANCANLLVFENPGAIADQHLQHCNAVETPERHDCMEVRLLDSLPAGLKVAQLAADPVDNAIWFTDAHGRYLGKLQTDGGRAIDIYPLDTIHEDLGEFAGFTWSLEVDEGAVYIGEYKTRHILRFDKTGSTFDEIEVPGSNSRVTLHSLAIDSATDRLWFTLSNDARFPIDEAASTIGFIDLDSWRSYIENPEESRPVNAVVYSGLEGIGASESAGSVHQNFTGVTVDPDSGDIALASFFRRQIVVLKPRRRFRP